MKRYAFELRFIATVEHEAADADAALQAICEHFDGHIITMEISATVDDEVDPTLIEIDGEKCDPPKPFPIRVPHRSIEDARVDACEKLRLAARALLEAEDLPDALPYKQQIDQLVGVIMSDWRQTRDVTLRTDKERSTGNGN